MRLLRGQVFRHVRILLIPATQSYPIDGFIQLLMRVVGLQGLSLVIHVLKRDPGINSLMPLLGILLHGRRVKAMFISKSEILAVVVPLSFI